MPSTTIILNGFNLLNKIKVSVNPNGGYQNAGQLEVTDGETAFEADDILVFHFDNADANLEVTQNSLVTGLTVYDSAADYFNDVVKYDYTTSGGINIRASNAGLGDNHLRFNGNSLIPSGPGHPDLSQVLIAAGTDLSVVESGTDVTLDRFTDNDYNEDTTISGGTVEEANGNFATENTIYAMVCYARGTLIDAPGAPRFIETLKPGDPINTLDHGAQPIRWISRRRVPGDGALAPVLIPAGALGNVRDLRVSPNHRMLVRGAAAELHFGQGEVLVAAKHLVNGGAIRFDPRPSVEYWHFLCDRHEIVFAEACASESLYLGDEAMRAAGDEGRAEILSIFPECRSMPRRGSLARYALNRSEAEVWRMCA